MMRQILCGAAVSVALVMTPAAAHAQSVTNPADHPAPTTVTIDGQTYHDGLDTLPGYDDEACTPIPNIQYDFGANTIEYYDGDGKLLDTAHWTEWDRISSYSTWKAQQNAATPTPTATAAPTTTSTTQATTQSAPSQPAATSPSTATQPAAANTGGKTTGSSTTTTRSGSKSSSGGRSTSSGRTTSTSTGTKTTTTTSPGSSSSSSTTSGSSSTSGSSASSAGGSSTHAAGSGGAATTSPAATATAAATGDPAAAPVATDTAAPAGGAAPVANAAAPAGTTQTVASGKGNQEATKFKLASQTLGAQPADNRLAGVGILVALFGLAGLGLVFRGFARLQGFGRP